MFKFIPLIIRQLNNGSNIFFMVFQWHEQKQSKNEVIVFACPLKHTSAH